MSYYLTTLSVFLGFLSATCWLRASLVRVSRDQEVARRKSEAKKNGVKPKLGGMTLDGWDLSGTLRKQAKWNSIAAVLASTSLLLQLISQLIIK